MAIGRISPYNRTEMSRNLVLDIRLLPAAAPTWAAASRGFAPQVRLAPTAGRLHPPSSPDLVPAQLLAQAASGEPGGPGAAGCYGPAADRASFLRPAGAGGVAGEPGRRAGRVRAARPRRRAGHPGGPGRLCFWPVPPRRHAGDPPAGCRHHRPGGLLPDLPAARNSGSPRSGRESAIRTWYGV